jgi:cytochrome P450
MADIREPVLIGDEFVQRTQEVLARSRAESPVRRVRFADGSEGWLVTRYEDVKALANDARVSRDWDGLTALRRAHGGGPDSDPFGGYGWLYRGILYLDPPDHTRLRKLVSKAFAPRAIDPLRPRIERVADELLDAMAGQDETDLMTAFASPLPRIAISELLGIPAEGQPEFWRWSEATTESVPGADLPDMLRSAAEYLGALAESKRDNPGPDLMSHMIMASEDGDRLSRKEVIAMALLMVLAGQDTTANLIANGTLALLRAPEQLARLRADPAVLPNAVEELLRYDGPINVAPDRFTTEPIEVGGVTIPAGEVLRVSLLSANHDTREFSDPDTLDISRDTGRHLGFGHGIHYCLGAPLARMEGTIAFGKLFTKFPGLRLAVPPEALRYRQSTTIHGLASLPVHLGRPV